jgi:hypothetical protein
MLERRGHRLAACAEHDVVERHAWAHRWVERWDEAIELTCHVQGTTGA